ncbi:MAG: hypothetical protein ACR2O4_13075, partial [Hyphomicrobiaceae bacterium]
IAGCLLFFIGGTLATFLAAQFLLGVHIAFNSGTDSALLYDSLKAAEREHEVADAEAKAARYSYTALAISAALGGLMASGWLGDSFALTYLVTAIAAVGALGITIMFTEPEVGSAKTTTAPALAQFSTVAKRLRDPVLRWMCIFFAGTYVLSHAPFLFVQPYLREMLADFDLVSETPFIIGLVIAIMMTMSATLAWTVVPLRNRLGTKAMFMIALVLYVVLIAAMAAFVHPLIIGLIILRMVPGTLTRPFLLEAIQPRLESSYRATYLSVQSLTARLLFSGILLATAWAVTGTGTLDRAGLAAVLPWYALGGAILTVWLWWTWPGKKNEQ